MKKIIILLIFFCAVQMAWAQKKQAVYLKNGSIINGSVTTEGNKITVKTIDGSVWVFTSSEVETVGKPAKPAYQKTKGLVSMTHFSIMTGKTNNEWNPRIIATPSIKTYLGYHFKPYFALGITTGIDGYADMALIPLALGIRGDLFASATTLYYGLDIGGALPWSKEGSGWNGNTTHKGGFLLNPMIGLKRYGHRGGGFYMQAAWSMQQASSEEDSSDWGGGFSKRKYTYKRLQLGIGLFF